MSDNINNNTLPQTIISTTDTRQRLLCCFAWEGVELLALLIAAFLRQNSTISCHWLLASANKKREIEMHHNYVERKIEHPANLLGLSQIQNKSH
jgi:hypothetical protein